VFGAERPACASREISKLYEEHVRGTLTDVLAHFNGKEPKGEFVLCVGGGE
jgi:16S rRNA (cytidine1402-2'-O)-methyltransferase